MMHQSNKSHLIETSETTEVGFAVGTVVHHVQALFQQARNETASQNASERDTIYNTNCQSLIRYLLLLFEFQRIVGHQPE